MSILAVRTKNYWKGDYEKITTELSEISWNEKLQDKSAEGMWLTFKQIVFELFRSAYTAQEKAPEKERSLDIEEHTQRNEETQ